jgi:hypothetical protein
MEKIKSKYIISQIRMYLPFKKFLEIFTISKFYQKKFDISINHFQFINEINIFINENSIFYSEYFDYFIYKFSNFISKEIIEYIIYEQLKQLKNIIIKLNSYHQYTNTILKQNFKNIYLIFPINKQLENINYNYNNYKISSLIFKGNGNIFLSENMVNKINNFIYSDNIQKLVIKDCILSKENYNFQILLKKLYLNQNLRLIDFSKNFIINSIDKKYFNLFLLNNKIQNFKINLSFNSTKKCFNELDYFKTMKKLNAISIICDLDFSSKVIEKLLFHSNKLKSITLSNVIISGNFDFSKFNNLEEFSICDSQGIINKFDLNSSLKKLKIKNVIIEEEILNNILNISKNTLEYFEINQKISNSKINNCIYSLKKIKYLKIINIEFPPIIFNLNLKNIIELKIELNEQLNSYFPDNLIQLKKISLKNKISIQKKCLLNILKVENLTKLSLKKIKLKGEIISILGNNLKNLRFLKSISLQENFEYLDDKNLIENLIINLKYCAFLQSLSIKNNNIDNKLFGILFFQFDNIPILQKLNISNNNIDQIGFSFLHLFSNKLKNLKKLCIKGNLLTFNQEIEEKMKLFSEFKSLIIIK